MKKKLHRLSSLLIIILCSSSFALAQIKFEPISTCEASSVKSQGRTGTCWSFSTSSFLESEFTRIHGKEVDLSEIFTVRNIYLEKAQKYLRYHGTCNFSQGSLAHDVINSYTAYGMMPEEAYSGRNSEGKHNHTALEKELKSYLDSMLKTKPIQEDWKVGFVEIMDAHLGAPPAMFTYEGVLYNPRTFTEKYLKLNMEDYVGFTSFIHHDFYDDFILEIPDNFSNGEYINLPIDELMAVIQRSLMNGISVEWDGDVSERGFMMRKGVALFNNDTNDLKKLPILPKEETSSAKLRQELFDAHITTDDHLMHITGMAKDENDMVYYRTKNSWGNKLGFDGYIYMSDAYMRMKTVSVVVHKDAIPGEILLKLKDQLD